MSGLNFNMCDVAAYFAISEDRDQSRLARITIGNLFFDLEEGDQQVGETIMLAREGIKGQLKRVR
jgi:hypothetical protein